MKPANAGLKLSASPWRTPFDASKPAEDLKKRFMKRANAGLKRAASPCKTPFDASKPAEDLKKRLKRKRQEQQRSSSKSAEQDGVVLVMQRYAELQECLQEAFWECNEVWQKNTSYNTEGPWKPWSAAWEQLQTILRGVFYETLSSTSSIEGHSEVQRSKLGNAAALLWTKIQGRKEESVLQHQIHYLQAVTQAIADDVCWKRILDELFTDESMTQETREQQVTHLEAQIGSTFVVLQRVTTDAREYALS